MKKLILLFTLLLTYQTSISQCTTSVTNFGNNTNPNYDVTGNITVTLNTDNTITLNLGNDFNTASGPDLRAYLVNPKSVSDNQLKTTPITSSNIEAIQFGLLTSFNGPDSFTVNIPNGTDISKFNKVFFYCLQFNQFWDFGSYTSFTPATCSLLSTEDNQINKISISPNPASNKIRIQNTANNISEIEIWNILGEQIYRYSGDLDKSLDVSALKSGVYILSATSEGKRLTKKLVIK